MLPLLAAIPTIFTTIGKVVDLFDDGKSAVEEVTGSKSEAHTPEELRVEVGNLSKEDQAKWSEVMSAKVDAYRAKTERLVVEQGAVPTNLSTIAANKVSIMRQTTRPWTIRCLVHYWLAPLYLMVVDTVQGVLHAFGLPITPYSAFATAFGNTVDKAVLESILSTTSTFGTVYLSALPYVTSIIISYMGLREVGKIKGLPDHPNQQTSGGMLKEGVGVLSKVTSLFKR